MDEVKREGIECVCYPSGELYWEIPYIAGKKEGIEHGYYESGKLHWEIPYHAGLKHGIEKEYENMETTQVIKETYWLYGVQVSKEFYYSDKTKLDPKVILAEKNAQKRMMYIQLIGMDRVIKELQPAIKEEITGDILYQNNPIGDYIQQGDVLIKPSPISVIPYEQLSDKMKEKLPQIIYQLADITIENETWRYLIMNSASHTDIQHCEGIPTDCGSVFAAICWRNKLSSLPYELT